MRFRRLQCQRINRGGRHKATTLRHAQGGRRPNEGEDIDGGNINAVRAANLLQIVLSSRSSQARQQRFKLPASVVWRVNDMGAEAGGPAGGPGLGPLAGPSGGRNWRPGGWCACARGGWRAWTGPSPCNCMSLGARMRCWARRHPGFATASWTRWRRAAAPWLPRYENDSSNC
jgi:hypothetical protein